MVHFWAGFISRIFGPVLGPTCMEHAAAGAIVKKHVILHYVLRRDLEVLNSPALRWLWFGAQECTAPEGEG